MNNNEKPITPQEYGVVRNTLSELGKRNAALSELIDILTDKLQCILLPPSKDPGDNAKEACGYSVELATQIGLQVSKLNDHGKKINELINRIDL